jgi:type III secretion system YscQ/HrcQ family protein
MAATPFDLAALPRLTGADLTALGRATARFGGREHRRELTVARFGRLSLTFSRVLPAVRPDESDSVWRLRRGTDDGWLIMGSTSGLRVVCAILGVPSPTIHRRMGTTERGVLAAAISSVLRGTTDVAFTGARPSDWRGAGLARIDARVEAATFHELFFLDVPPAWIPAPPLEQLVTQLRGRDVRITVVAELARTRLGAAEWSRAQPGDAVVFDAAAIDESEARPLTVRIACGQFAAPADLDPSDPGGEARLVSDLSIDDDRRPAGAISHNPMERIVMANETSRSVTDTVLASAPVEVVAELGRVALRADEVATLRAGAVLTLGPRPQDRIALRVGERLWATGELVNVDGQLGVRLTALAP